VASGSVPEATAARERGPLLSFEFLGVCLVAFLAVCNVTVFYDLFGYLATLGVAGELRGVLVGAYSLTAMVLYVVGSPFLGVRRAPGAMLAGIAILAATGWSYLLVTSFWGLLAIRLLNGAGYFLLGAGATALLVTFIPPGRSGQAFGIYSVAILVSYGLVPAVMDALAPHLPSAAHGYAAATVSLAPAAFVVTRLRRRLPPAALASAHAASVPWGAVRTNLASPSIPILILLSLVYFANWNALFYLFKGYALERGAGNVGAFFVVLTGLMIAIRVIAGRLFDRVNKVPLVAASFAMIAIAHVVLAKSTARALPLSGALFGLGLGAGYPAINGLMFERSAPALRPLNANLLLASVQGGALLGPAAGGALVARHGYPGYFFASVVLAIGAAALSGALALAAPRRRSA
jgi:MFS family permease